MKKENVLVVVLICMAVVGGIFYYQASKTSQTDLQTLSKESVSVSKNSSKIAWSGLSEGLAQAKKRKKHIFLYFYADWCTYCKKLKQTTFKDKNVLRLLADGFVSIGINTDKYPQIAKQWKVTGLPTMWLLKPDGSRISSIPGYVTADQLVKFLEYIRTASYEKIKFHDFVKTL